MKTDQNNNHFDYAHKIKQNKKKENKEDDKILWPIYSDNKEVQVFIWMFSFKRQKSIYIYINMNFIATENKMIMTLTHNGILFGFHKT